MNYKFGKLFGDGQKVSNTHALDAMEAQKAKAGGVFHFTVFHHDDGWTAECAELEGILTGGVNPAPTDNEIEARIAEALRTAFHIPSVREDGPKRIINASEIGAIYSVQHKEVTVR